MKELRSICEAYQKTDFKTQRVALATVVRVKGSSYRSPGTRMLIKDNGTWVGSISGGCLEGDALRKARKVMTDKQCFATTYDTTEEANSQFSINLGCKGIIDVLFEPVDPEDENNPMQLLERFSRLHTSAALATIFEGNEELLGRKMLLHEGAIEKIGELPDALSTAIQNDLLLVQDKKKSWVGQYDYKGETIEVFLEHIEPQLQLMIFGGGFDARPLAQMAKSLDWNVNVTDECVAHIAPAFFPSADKLSLCDRKFVDRELDMTANTACVLMSHNYDYDRDVLKKLIATDTPYIGILGPRKRFDEMIEEFDSDGMHLSEEDLDRIHSPIGVDIGAETPYEIGIAIIAEIMGRFSRRDAGYLKHRNGPIHRRESSTNEVLKESL